MKKCKVCNQNVQLVKDESNWSHKEFLTGRKESWSGGDETTLLPLYNWTESNFCYHHNKVLVGLFGIDKMNKMKKDVFTSV